MTNDYAARMKAYEMRAQHSKARLTEKADIEHYRGRGSFYNQPTDVGSGHTTIPVLQFLWGLPLSNLILAYVHGLRPSQIRISTGEVTTDSWQERVTIFVDAQDVVQSIEMEISVLYTCGADVNAELERQQKQLFETRLIQASEGKDAEELKNSFGKVEMEWAAGLLSSLPYREFSFSEFRDNPAILEGVELLVGYGWLEFDSSSERWRVCPELLQRVAEAKQAAAKNNPPAAV